MAGNMTFDQLKKAVAAGDIDTVLACAVDMQGRLIGKRFLAKYFVESAWEEMHGCNYLLAIDIDQEVVNIRYAEAREMADRHSILKNGCKEIAHLMGKSITFMAKYNYSQAGSS